MSETQDSFDWASDRPAAEPLSRAVALAVRLGALARDDIFLGASSWKYPGWLNQIYQPSLYEVRRRFSQKKFEQECLAEYARIFPTVGGDFSHYRFPTAQTWKRLFDQVPEGFRFSLKVPEEITLERFPNLPRYGRRAGMVNPHFMDAELLRGELLDALAPHHSKLGALMFEFATIHDGPYNDAAQFCRLLGPMLARSSPDRFLLAVEIRNPEFLDPASPYLDCLRDHGVAHCINSWTRMPPLDHQMEIAGICTARHVVARLLLRPGRTYDQAVKAFSPYEKIQDPYPEGRAALRGLIERCRKDKNKLFAYVNNRLEGNAVETIERTIGDLLDGGAFS